MIETPESRPRGRPRGAEGVALLDAARAVFLESGFHGATMDAIARRAGVSKASLYRDHPSKEELFAATISDWVARGRDAMRPFVDRLRTSDDVREGLLALARVLQVGLLSSDVLGVRALVASESGRLPEVASGYRRDSWGRNLEVLARAIADLDASGRLEVGDPRSAAEQFTWLVVGGPLNTAELGGRTPRRALDDGAHAAVETFLARYGV